MLKSWNCYTSTYTAKDWREDMIRKYPYLRPQNIWTAEILEDYDFEYLNGEHDLPSGWFNLFLQMCEDIKQPLVDAGCLVSFRFSQLKEKYGSMRCYYFGAPEEIGDIIHKYEYLSRYVCADCGKPATRTMLGWIIPYCSKCYRKHSKKHKEFSVRLHFKPVYKITGLKNGEKYSNKVSVRKEWQRYLRSIK